MVHYKGNNKCRYTFLKDVSIIQSAEEFHFKIKEAGSFFDAPTHFSLVLMRICSFIRRKCNRHTSWWLFVMVSINNRSGSQCSGQSFPFPYLENFLTVFVNPVLSLKYKVQISLCVRGTFDGNYIVIILSFLV